MVFAYAGESNAFTADLPNRHDTALQGRYCRRREARHTFKIVDSLAVENPDPVLEPCLATAEKVHDISYLLRCLLLLLGG